MQTNFKYDGLGRRIAIDTTSGGVISETRYQWCGETLCQARSGSDTASRRYLAEGENSLVQQQTFYYGIDQLGSVRDALTVPSGGVAAHYDYDLYGMQTNTALASTDIPVLGQNSVTSYVTEDQNTGIRSLLMLRIMEVYLLMATWPKRYQTVPCTSTGKVTVVGNLLRSGVMYLRTI